MDKATLNAVREMLRAEIGKTLASMEAAKAACMSTLGGVQRVEWEQHHQDWARFSAAYFALLEFDDKLAAAE